MYEFLVFSNLNNILEYIVTQGSFKKQSVWYFFVTKIPVVKKNVKSSYQK